MFLVLVKSVKEKWLMPFAQALTNIHKRLEPVVVNRQPLHVPQLVVSPGAQGNDVIDLPAWAWPLTLACGGAGLHLLEAVHLGS